MIETLHQNSLDLEWSLNKHRLMMKQVPLWLSVACVPLSTRSNGSQRDAIRNTINDWLTDWLTTKDCTHTMQKPKEWSNGKSNAAFKFAAPKLRNKREQLHYLRQFGWDAYGTQILSSSTLGLIEQIWINHNKYIYFILPCVAGGLAQLVERVLSMHEVARSSLAFSTPSFYFLFRHYYSSIRNRNPNCTFHRFGSRFGAVRCPSHSLYFYCSCAAGCYLETSAQMCHQNTTGEGRRNGYRIVKRSLARDESKNSFLNPEKQEN